MKQRRHQTIYQRKSAFKKREDTLGKAYANRNKRGYFTDSRQKKTNESYDDIRQTMLDASESASESVHVLTHRGIPIKDLKRNTPVNRDEGSEVVDADTVNDLHFGGGLFTAQGTTDRPMSFKDKMHDLIQRSKEKKAGHQLHQEEVHDNVVKADENWVGTMEKIAVEFDQKTSSKLKRKLQENVFRRNRQAIMEMNTVVNLLQSSGEKSSGGNALSSEAGSARSMNRLNQYLDENKNSNDEESSSITKEDVISEGESMDTDRKSQPFLEILHCMDILMNINDEKQLQAISALCHNLQQPVRRVGRLVGGLLISNLLSKATTMRGKSSPELHRFLINALMLAIPNSQRPKDYFTPLSSTSSLMEFNGRLSNEFKVDEMESIAAMEACMDKSSPVTNGLIGLHCLILTLCLIEREITASKKRGASAPEVLTLMVDGMKRLPTMHYPSTLKSKIEEIVRLAETTVRPEEVRPVMQWTEPSHKEIEMIEPIFGDELKSWKRASKTGKRTPLTKEEKTRLLKKKVKAERKSAMRELRRDTEFLQIIKRKEQVQKDAERKKKVARILGDLATQEGDFRKLNKH